MPPVTQPIEVVVEFPAGTPWFYVPVLAGVFAIVGVTIAQLVSYRLFKAKNQRDEQRRWDKDRRETYAKFLRIIGQWMQALDSYHELYSVEQVHPPESSIDEAREAFENIAMIAPNQVVLQSDLVLLEINRYHFGLVQDLPENCSLEMRREVVNRINDNPREQDISHLWASSHQSYEMLRTMVREEFGLEPLEESLRTYMLILLGDKYVKGNESVLPDMIPNTEK